MTLPPRLPGIARRAGFTLLEIAVALAVIGFAIVAVLGVLPTGLNIQRDTRERTIILHDAQYFMDAIRHGTANSAAGETNLVYRVDKLWLVGVTNGTMSVRELSFKGGDFKNDGDLIRWLSMPYIPTNGVRFFTAAVIRSLNGMASEKGGEDPDDGRIVFSYMLTSEVAGISSVAPETVIGFEKFDAREFSQRTNQLARLEDNLSELRFTVQWPGPFPVTYDDKWTPRNQLEFRTYMSGIIGVGGTNFLQQKFFEPRRLL